MKNIFLSLAVCPRCIHELILGDFQSERDEVVSGILRCSNCSSEFEIKDGIPWFEHTFDKETDRNFGYSWGKFADIYVNQKEDFLNWIYPVRPDFFKDKTVLDAGAGNGLHSCFASDFGAKHVYAIDLSTAVKEAYKNSRDYQNIYVSQANIYAPPFKEESFDYIYSIGVIQHLPEREKGLEKLAALVKKGGHLSIWVYGHEGTFFVRKFIEPLRRVVLKMNLKLVYILSFPLAGLFYLNGKVYRLLAKVPVLNRLLPMKSYFLYMAEFPFHYQHNSVYDQLIAPRTYYFKKEELEKIFKELNFEHITITNRNAMSWRVFAQSKL